MFETDRLPAVFVPRCGRCFLLGCWQCGMLHSVFVFKGYRGGGHPPPAGHTRLSRAELSVAFVTTVSLGTTCLAVSSAATVMQLAAAWIEPLSSA